VDRRHHEAGGRRALGAALLATAGLERIKHVFDPGTDAQQRAHWTVPEDILRRLKRDPTIWRNFSRFPQSYRRIRIGWIDAARRRADIFEQRLAHFLKMTAQNKRFGMVQ
jgi:uncharacterized protein YdeI (YjbR/CyaY-like superfamily)